MAEPKLTVSELNCLSHDQFVDMFGNVIEHSPVIVAGAWHRRPFKDLTHFTKTLHDIIDRLPTEVHCGILSIHPDLAGRLAEAGQLTQESTKEQSSAGLDTVTGDQLQMIRTLNERYKEKFGFPFVICVRLSNLAIILDQLEKRVNNDKNFEIRTGINEVKKICLLRIKDLLIDEENFASKL